ncbi:helix-turn-helix transcriptional regulator [Fuscibacter oryzae]|uniref:Helix-turn-helix transcriptional regulator n=1 Tax=Fuscibacter oryzae TaxID=2803939 RepID=A0A8J7MP76_9RHOB|nr:helix-turn-helix transcriptional regulator [Fuscibacter oryzae]MBL4927133.1 helix-turn-helix transcriptional regulator [Fuscibacter oryzae]
MRDDSALTNPLPGVVLRQARRARMHGIVPTMPSLIQVRRGSKEVIATQLALTITEGQFVLLPDALPMTICNIPDAGGQYEAMVLPLPRAAAERALARLPAVQRPTARAPQPVVLPAEGEALFAAFFAPSPFAALPADVLVLKLEEMALWLALSGGVLAAEGLPRLADRLRGLIAADPAADWVAANVARLLGASEATLRRKLAAEGESFGAILRDVRLTHALGLLQTTPFPIARVAAEAGYASPQQFATRFRARFGLSPHEIRTPEVAIDRIGAKIARTGAAGEGGSA